MPTATILRMANFAAWHGPNGAGNEWYTPPDLIEAARQLMDGIDLDPASNEAAQTVIRASTYFTEQHDGLAHDVKAIELWPCRYDAPCKVKNCKAKATTIARSVDAGGRPRLQHELCASHAESVAERERGKGREIIHRP
jgi:hypothetical protein